MFGSFEIAMEHDFTAVELVYDPVFISECNMIFYYNSHPEI